MNLFKAHARNTSLAEEYRRLQYDFISVKTLALQIVEKKLVMEESLRDHKQVTNLQLAYYLVHYVTHLFVQLFTLAAIF